MTDQPHAAQPAAPEPTAQDDVRPSWAVLKKSQRNVVQSVRVPLRGDLLDAVSLLEADLRVAQREDARQDGGLNREPRAPGIARRIEELEAEARTSEVWFRFEGLGRGKLAKLEAQHVPTREQRETISEDLMWNPETFPPALMAASCVEPAELRGNVEEFAEIYDNWSQGQLDRMWRACQAANMMGGDVPKSELASAILRQADSESS